jgi:broad specificity phosphatase PhoE
MRNQYFLLRHGQSLKNVKNIASSWPEKFYSPLTGKGKRQAKEVAEKLKMKKIDLIFSSDLLRTKQTAEIIGKRLGIKPRFDKRLREIKIGAFNGKPIAEIGKFWRKKEGNLIPLKHYLRRYKFSLPGGENYLQAEKRMQRFLKETDKKYSGKKILIVSHQRPITLLEGIVSGQSREKTAWRIVKREEIRTGEIKRLKVK